MHASPADRGRDIVAEVERTDVDGSKHGETWFIDCKHYAKGVPPEALQGLLTWAQAERPDVALVIASGWLSNPAKDYLRDYEDNNRPPFRIKYWERPILDKLTLGNRQLLDRFLIGGMRTQSEIIAAEEEFFDKVWHERHLVLNEDLENDPEQPEKIAGTIIARWERRTWAPTATSSGAWSTASSRRCDGSSGWSGTSWTRSG